MSEMLAFMNNYDDLPTAARCLLESISKAESLSDSPDDQSWISIYQRACAEHEKAPPGYDYLELKNSIPNSTPELTLAESFALLRKMEPGQLIFIKGTPFFSDLVIYCDKHPDPAKEDMSVLNFTFFCGGETSFSITKQSLSTMPDEEALTFLIYAYTFAYSQTE